MKPHQGMQRVDQRAAEVAGIVSVDRSITSGTRYGNVCVTLIDRRLMRILRVNVYQARSAVTPCLL